MTASTSTYQFFFFIGNSGAGKDTTMKIFENILKELEIPVLNLKRVITRDAHSSEDFISVAEDKFKDLAENDEFAFYWKIYGNYYGYRKEDIQYCRDNNVVALFNISRSLIQVIQEKYPDAKFVRVTAPIETSKSRILKRKRGDSKNNILRVDRMTKEFKIPDDVIDVDNSGDLDNLRDRVEDLVHQLFLDTNEIILPE